MTHRHTQKSRSCSSNTPHPMGHGPGQPVKTRGRPHGHGGRRRSSSSSTPHLMGSGPGRPVKTHGPPHGPGRAAHIEPTSHGPRPGPAHQIFREWAAAQPSPLQISEGGPRPGPAHHIFTARPGPSHFQQSRPGPAHQISNSLGPAQPITFSKVSARPRQTAHDKPWNFPYRFVGKFMESGICCCLCYTTNARY